MRRILAKTGKADSPRDPSTLPHRVRVVDRRRHATRCRAVRAQQHRAVDRRRTSATLLGALLLAASDYADNVMKWLKVVALLHVLFVSCNGGDGAAKTTAPPTPIRLLADAIDSWVLQLDPMVNPVVLVLLRGEDEAQINGYAKEILAAAGKDLS